MQDTPETPGAGGSDPAGPTPPPTPPAPPAASAGATASTAASGRSKGLFDRTRDIIVQPKREWDVIDAEPATIAGIYTSYAMILAAIGPVAMLIGQQIFGLSFLGITYTPPLGYSLVNAIVTYALSLGALYVFALIIDALAPTFGGTKNPVNAFKLAAYSSTPGWVAGILFIIPALWFVGLLGSLYGLYVLYLGIPRLMRVSEDKAVGYTIVAVIANIVLYFVVAMIVASIAGSFMTVPSLPVRY